MHGCMLRQLFHWHAGASRSVDSFAPLIMLVVRLDDVVQATPAAGGRRGRRTMEAAAALQEGQGEAPGLQRMRTRAHDASSTLGEAQT